MWSQNLVNCSQTYLLVRMSVCLWDVTRIKGMCVITWYCSEVLGMWKSPLC